MNEKILESIKDNPSRACLFFVGDKLLIATSTKTPFLVFQETLDTLNLKPQSILQDGEVMMCLCEISLSTEALEKKNYSLVPIKRFLAELDLEKQAIILRALHWLNWDKQSQFCGHCGKPLEYKQGSTEKKCLNCNLSIFPRFSPAVMVLIQHENKILLARSPHFEPGFYSAIAGFVEIGETAEQTAHREVKEELGIEIQDLEYFATQTWPFPDSFMIAYKAHYKSGQLNIDADEIEDARWFSHEDLPQLPSHASIARKLIQHVLARIAEQDKKAE